MLRAGSGEPLVLLHGVLGSGRHWTEVVPLLADTYDVVATDALGHVGGRPAQPGATITDIVDDAEKTLDELGFDKPHVAGNSMGGWIALELARRGRARSVCAFSPAGAFHKGEPDQLKAEKKLRAAIKEVRRGQRLSPFMVRFAWARKYGLRLTAVDGSRVRPELLLELGEDVLGCTSYDAVLATTEELAPLDPPPCPITIAWSGEDRVLPLRSAGARYRDELVPGARFVVLDNIGHVPMFDDPELVARTIRAAAT